jgi:DNA-binding beta-propeller fold protein YncE
MRSSFLWIVSSMVLVFLWLAQVGGSEGQSDAAATADYAGPCALAASKDGKTLYVACADARHVAWIDLRSGMVTRRVVVEGEPTGVVLTPDGTRLVVTCAAPRSCRR